MNIETINLVYFSPTKTTKKIIEVIAQGIAAEKINEIDLTTKSSNNKIKIDKKHLTIFGAPVYGGRIPENATKRFKNILSDNSHAVVIAVYGNRAYDDALIELKDISESCGFKTIAAGAFIGEHSFSMPDKPVAHNRPDKNDIRIAEQFGKEISKKLKNKTSFDNVDELIIPGIYPYRELKNRPVISPETIYDKCILCGECVEICPNNAIKLEDKVHTDNEKCIWCFACVKYCTQEARVMENEIIIDLQNFLVEKCSVSKEPELFM